MCVASSEQDLNRCLKKCLMKTGHNSLVTCPKDKFSLSPLRFFNVCNNTTLWLVYQLWILLLLGDLVRLFFSVGLCTSSASSWCNDFHTPTFSTAIFSMFCYWTAASNPYWNICGELRTWLSQQNPRTLLNRWERYKSKTEMWIFSRLSLREHA